ncbi:DNA-binding transcriptional regulator DsdC [Pseudomonas chlororaphis]|uniref:Colanic acid biosynthesis glycosyltransferase WcaA n=1 Tax=Pseudomonas chlororaphis TaxID=587753 RepID=A0A1Q8ERU1_9PSED|nr:DNA-binding transcriptional regulator DsdC [Pseudomonas chlororaphis]OLF54516.1 colanic acid biosynthesis glycosyltransferase WcaA [Pseudomonas chlororaphis]
MYNLPPRLAAKLNGSQFSNLFTFQVAARHLSFSKAADELCLTASAVSHRIARLEAELSIQLFQRLTRRVQLTEAGERIFAILQQTLGDLSEVLAQPLDADLAGPLTLYAHPSIAHAWLVPRLAEFGQRFPGVKLDLRVGNDRIDFRSRQIDLALYYGTGEFHGLSAHRLMQERVAPVCSPQYAERHGLYGAVAQLEHCTLLHDSLAWEHAAFDSEWALWLRQQGEGLALPKRGLTFDRSDLCVTAAIHHAGVAIGREHLVSEALGQGRLVLPFNGFARSGEYAYYIVHPALDVLPRRVSACIEWLRECAAHTPHA